MKIPKVNMSFDHFALWALWAFVLLFCADYFLYFSTIAYDSDLAILTSFAQRMLDGHKFTEMYYETNPPLSIIIYVPVLWIKSLLGLDIYYAHFLYSLILLVSSIGMSAYLLWRLDYLDWGSRHTILLGYILTQTLVPASDLGDRDHLVFLGLFPFVLGQLVWINRSSIPMIIYFGVFLFGAIIILLKPHYGLIPTVFLLYRFIKFERYRVLFAPDFIALSLGIIVYAIILYVFFYDFIILALPDIITLYISHRSPVIWFDFFVCISILIIFLGVLSTTPLVSKEKQILYFFACMILLLLIPYLVQGKALNYHRIPYLSVWFMTGMIGIFFFLRMQFRQKNGFAMIISIIVIGLAIVTLRGIPATALTHESFRKLPLSLALDRHCPEYKQCSFLLLSDISDNIHRLSIYHKAFHASRFTSMWYLPGIFMSERAFEEGGKSPFTQSEIILYADKYRAMVADDLERFKPDVIIILENPFGYSGFEFLDFYSENEIFRTEFTNYERVESISFDRRVYFPGLTTVLDNAPHGDYAIFIRKGN